MKQDHKSTVDIRQLTVDDAFLTRAGEIQEIIARRAADISRDEMPPSERRLDHWLQAEAELLQPVALDVRETDNELIVSAKAPGFRESELEVWVEPRRLYIAGTAVESTKERRGVPLYSEWRSNRILREFRLPVAINPEIVETQLRRGVLEIVFQKAKEIQTDMSNVPGKETVVV